MRERKGAIFLSPQFLDWVKARGEDKIIANLKELQSAYVEGLAYKDADPERLARLDARYTRLLSAIRAAQAK